MIVADANLLVYLHVQGDRTPDAEAVLRRDSVWLAPLLWRSEFRNAMVNLIHSAIIDLDDAIRFATAAERQMRGREYAVDSRDVLLLAHRSRCSAYDREYVTLARYVAARLVTVDSALLRAFPDTAVSPAAFAG